VIVAHGALSGVAPRRVGLPPSAGPISEMVLAMLAGPANGQAAALAPGGELEDAVAAGADPLADDDLQLALYICYELHYRSFPEIDPAWEWSPALIAIRGALERVFLERLRAELPSEDEVEPRLVGDRLFELEAADDGPSVGRWLERRPDLGRFREFVAHRSLYQLKEADPHSWAIPRLAGPAKAALLEVQSDEYGGGRPERMHSELFAKTMRALGLDDRENAYLDRVPGITMATVNLMSAFGLHAALRGALVGHLSMFEITSAGPNRRYGNALRRLGCGTDATDFYDEHVEADAVHENIAAYDLAGGFARMEPGLAPDVLFGARALLHLERRFAEHVLGAWERGGSSLRRAL
jgi:Iron-containing redox enzyme